MQFIDFYTFMRGSHSEVNYHKLFKGGRFVNFICITTIILLMLFMLLYFDANKLNDNTYFYTLIVAPVIGFGFVLFLLWLIQFFPYEENNHFLKNNLNNNFHLSLRPKLITYQLFKQKINTSGVDIKYVSSYLEWYKLSLLDSTSILDKIVKNKILLAPTMGILGFLATVVVNFFTENHGNEQLINQAIYYGSLVSFLIVLLFSFGTKSQMIRMYSMYLKEESGIYSKLKNERITIE